ncbi:MAG: hypothetical protein GC160_05990 [Acidobacteria bacterium]|nr:hypothetical protein [Acidobacteriota bacterium]
MRGWLIAALLAATLACNPKPEAAPPAIERVYEDGSARVTLRIDKDRINMAQSLTVHVEAVVNENERVEFPEKIGSPEDFRTASSEVSNPRLLDDGRIAVERVYELDPYAPGTWTLPPFRVECFDPQAADATPQAIETEPIEVTVDTVLTVDPQQADIDDIRDPLTAPLPWGWIAAGVAVLALLAWWLWKRRSQKVAVEEAEPPPPPYQVALSRLDALLRSELLQQGAWKQFYLELTALLRSYIEGQFSLRAPEQTTEEFLADLRRGLAFNPQHRDLLRQILQHGDMVKFAELQPSRHEAVEAADLCRRFIEETRPRPTPAGEAGPGGAAPTMKRGENAPERTGEGG